MKSMARENFWNANVTRYAKMLNAPALGVKHYSYQYYPFALSWHHMTIAAVASSSLSNLPTAKDNGGKNHLKFAKFHMATLRHAWVLKKDVVQVRVEHGPDATFFSYQGFVILT